MKEALGETLAKEDFHFLFSFYSHDGETASRRYLEDETQISELLEFLSNLPVTEAKDWSPSDLVFPLYGLEYGRISNPGFQVALSNGYLI